MGDKDRKRAMALSMLLVVAASTAGGAAFADRGRHDGGRRFERPAPAEQRHYRDERRARDDVDAPDYRRRERLSDDERRRLREDIDAASREIYRRR